MKKCKFLFLWIFCFLFLFPVCRAEAAGSGTVKNAVLNVRSDATTSSSIVCKITKGTTVKIESEKIGRDGRKWYSVSFTYNNKSKTGYVRSDLVNVVGASTAAVTPVTAGTAEYYMVSGSAVNVREHASVGAGKVATLQRGTEVKYKSTEQGADGRAWYMVSFTYNNEKKHGYIRSDLLAATSKTNASTAPTATAPSSSASSSSSDMSKAEEGDTVYVKASAVRVRGGASNREKIIANLLQGDKVEFIKEKTGDDDKKWTKVNCTINGTTYTGYIRSDLLSREKVNFNDGDTDYRYVIKPAGVRVRKSAETGSRILTNLLCGDRAEVVKEKTGDDGKKWTKISFDIDGTHFEGYVHSYNLSKTAP